MTYFRLLAAGLVALPAASHAQTGFADLAAIDRAVEHFTGAPIGAVGGARTPVDRRMRLALCSSALALGSYGQRQDTIRVECPDAGGWRIFVSLAAAPQAAQPQNLVARGDMVNITVEGRGFSVAQTGEALEAGAQGAWIRVKPSGAKEAVKAQIIRPGRVSIPLF